TFESLFTDFIAKLDSEPVSEAIPMTKKARSQVAETRDTIHPKFVTEMLTAFLRAIGKPDNIPRIYKHTRDGVMWTNAEKPCASSDTWRRSPLWLLI
ncbi:hypothetical protein V2W45_1198875, partial [Cenococcum geophilum]